MAINSLENDKGEASIVSITMRKILETRTNAEKDPRLSKAVACFNPKEITKAIQALQNDPALPVLAITPFEIEKGLGNNSGLGILLQYPNVRAFEVLNATTETFFDAFKKSKRESMGQLSPEKAMESAMGIIRHDLGHALKGHANYDKRKLLDEARAKLGFEGDDEALVKKVMEPSADAEVAEFRNVPGVFVDWDGTLQKQSGLDRALLDRARELAKAKGLPLVIWTGGDPDGVLRELAKEGVTDINACSKQDCQGLRVTLAIDDEPLEFLRRTYGIDAKEFEKVTL